MKERPIGGWITCALILALSASLHLWLLWTLAPDELTFVPTRTIEGRYAVEPGSVNVPHTSRVGKKVIFCIVSHFGHESPCPTKFDGRNVAVKLASYRHAFGKGEVAMVILADDGYREAFPANYLVSRWWTYSRWNAFWATLATAVLLGYGYSILEKLRRWIWRLTARS